MRTFIIFFIVLFLSTANPPVLSDISADISLGTIEWEWTFEVVSTESISGSYSHEIVIDEMDHVHVVWSDQTDYLNAGTDSDIFYKQWNGISWSAAEIVSTESTEYSGHPDIAIDSLGNLHVVWHDPTQILGAGSNYDIFYKTYNGTWSTTEVLSTESTDGVAAYNPTIAVDSADNLHVAWRDTSDYLGAGSDWDIFYKKNNGSWGLTQVISTESSGDSFN